ncbi:MAG: threonine--tRNA ligase [Candidatus Aminicenantes bacterium 4484_214]|nr:MAG: threonine--tRNA ligase [Candidatus Aminicenantes bacterium 4484_214]RLE09207.1 MAG: threonine--tRNA ligase [Candidatus Aminicenantes bacterium]
MAQEKKGRPQEQKLVDSPAPSLEVLRHSAAHLLAQAVLDLFPGTQVGIGPAVENGFYYDFLRDKPFTPEDLEAIEQRMRELVKEDIPIERIVIPKAEAIKLFQDMGQDLKVELIKEKGGDQVSCYRQRSFIDFCLGPHLPSTGAIKYFKLLSVSGAYWRGDERGPQLQRIYGTAFFTKQDLENYLHFLEEARQRDHRRLGADLDLFSFDELVGPGLVLWHPRAGAIRKEIEDYWHEEHFQDGYEFLYTPHIAKLDVWRTSGHTEFYEAMFPPFQSEGIEYELKPMNCPFHIMIYKSRLRSYRDLPLRWAELGTVYRYERSGVLHGLLRVRGFTQDDAHIFCRDDQLEEEITRVISLALRMLRTFGFVGYDLFLSTRPEKYVGSEEDWDQATQALKKALEKQGLSFQIDEGEGVFYGPKIDMKIKDALGRSWQCTTIQLDFNLAERFDLSYTGEDGQPHRPFLIHRAILGSLERFFGILIEHYKGNFPLWLAPVQMSILPIADRHNEYADQLNQLFRREGIRSVVNSRREKIGHKIREAEMAKVPVILIIGDRELQKETVSLRVHTVGDKGEWPVSKLLEKIKILIKNKAITYDF